MQENDLSAEQEVAGIEAKILTSSLKLGKITDSELDSRNKTILHEVFNSDALSIL